MVLDFLEITTLFSDGMALPVNRRQRVYPNGTLVIEHAEREADAGTYTCQAQNRQKHIARRDVEVQVLGMIYNVHEAVYETYSSSFFDLQISIT